MSSNRKTEVIHARIPLALREKIGVFIRSGSYRNESHFIREAVEEKISRGSQ